jgi:hypothetical protein
VNLMTSRLIRISATDNAFVKSTDLVRISPGSPLIPHRSDIPDALFFPADPLDSKSRSFDRSKSLPVEGDCEHTQREWEKGNGSAPDWAAFTQSRRQNAALQIHRKQTPNASSHSPHLVNSLRMHVQPTISTLLSVLNRPTAIDLEAHRLVIITLFMSL